MSGYIAQVLGVAAGTAPVVQPRRRALFEDARAADDRHAVTALESGAPPASTVTSAAASFAAPPRPVIVSAVDASAPGIDSPQPELDSGALSAPAPPRRSAGNVAADAAVPVVQRADASRRHRAAGDASRELQAGPPAAALAPDERAVRHELAASASVRAELAAETNAHPPGEIAAEPPGTVRTIALTALRLATPSLQVDTLRQPHEALSAARRSRARAVSPASGAAPATQHDDAVHVHIERIDVRVPPPQPAVQRAPAKPRSVGPPLAAYLQRAANR